MKGYVFMSYISFFVLVFVGILAATTLLNMAYEALLDRITDRRIVLNAENSSKAEYMIRSSLAKNDSDIMVIDDGMSVDALQILAHLQRESGRIILTSMKEE